MSSQVLLRQILQQTSNPELISRAFAFAKEAHRGQKRLSGEDYINHPLATAVTLSEMRLDPATVTAALLHDVPDDTPRTIEDIEREFGKEIAFLVNGVSKLGQLRLPKEDLRVKPVQTRIETPVDLESENLRKMFLAMAEDLRVILIKLADRLHNLQTLNVLPPQRQQRIALETMEILAPIANRLGIGEIKGQLEDLAFPYLYPKEFSWLMDNVKTKYEERKKYIEQIKPVLYDMLRKENVQVIDIHARAKHYWSLYQKLLRDDMNLERIYDLVALRVLVDTTENCYRTLGIIHQHWKPLPGLIKDYIAFPKPNNYRSLHTTCFCLDGKITEIQIKTPEMHQEAEYGIAAHWAYKERLNLESKALRRKFSWVAQLREWQKQRINPEEFWEGLKIDFFKNRIFALTPKGDVIDLPEGATPVDFAYAVHTDLGNKCSGAKVNGKLVQLSSRLANGDVVEILTEKNKTPSRDWLDFVKTNAAKSRIKEWLKKESRPENFRRGLSLLNQTFQQLKGITFSGLPEEKKQAILHKLNYKDVNRLVLAVGEGEIGAKTVLKSIFSEDEWLTAPAQKVKIRIPKSEVARGKNVLLAGQTGLAVYFAKCCLPQPNDAILGYIAKTRGAAIHKQDCQNLLIAKQKWPQKIVNAEWQNVKYKAPYPVSLRIIASEDRIGLLRDITSAISSIQGNIVSCHTTLQNGNPPLISLKIEISEAKNLETVFRELLQVRGVKEVRRV